MWVVAEASVMIVCSLKSRERVARYFASMYKVMFGSENRLQIERKYERKKIDSVICEKSLC